MIQAIVPELIHNPQHLPALIATKEDVDLGGHYNCHGGAINQWC